MRRSLALLFCFWVFKLSSVHCDTSQTDLDALNNMFVSLGSPPQLASWIPNGGDPCGQSWTGITCNGSSVMEIKLSGLGLSGSLGFTLDKLTSLINLDLSANNVTGQIPYQLPPNSQQINLAGNGLSGGIPYSISQMLGLTYLNLSHNQFQNPLDDFFQQLTRLTILDLSFNALPGNLPSTFSSLSNLTTLNLQNNQLTGTIDILAHLPLENLNVAYNHFTGSIPLELLTIKNLQTEGNSFATGPSSQNASLPSGTSNTSGGGRGKKSGASGGIASGIVITLLFVGGVVAFFLLKRRSRISIDEEKIDEGQPFSLLQSNEIRGSHINASMKEFKSMQSAISTMPTTLQPSQSMALKPPPVDRYKSFDDGQIPKRNVTIKRVDPSLIDASVYSSVDLQMATHNYSINSLLGEGSFGRVYKARFADGKILAVKKINSLSLPNQESDEFIEVASNISHLRHPNITELVGYCCDRGQYLLVYEFMRNGSLHDYVHLVDDSDKSLSWNARVKIALGTARALEYLHEACSPSVIHKNLKSANILLDVELNPHLSDCGLANLVPSREFQELHQNSCLGYTAPEVAITDQYTLKSDVYSFGVAMLEVMTGRLPFDSSRPRNEQYLVNWATPQLHDIDALTKMVDPALKDLYPIKSLSRFADVIALCVQPEPEFRPPMSEVVRSLVTLVQRTNMSKRTTGSETMHSRLVDNHDN